MGYKGPLILVTGGAGYVGSTFVRDALARGYRVRCLDILIYSGKALVGFLNNPNFGPKGNLEKITRWFESIYAGYPFDASMAAALAKSYTMMNDRKSSLHYKKRFNKILQESGYWQNRVKEFPEILEMVKA